MNLTEPLSTEELAALDAAYRPFPSFADWPAHAPRPDMWASALGALDDAKANASEQDFRRASQTAIRAAAFDTGAIEHLYETSRGLTITVATQAAAWEATVNQQAPNALALFQAQLRAYELVLDVATQSLPVSEAWIRRLHEELTAPQETYLVHTPVGPQEQSLPHGRYKDHPNHVKLQDGKSHSYASVLDTPVEMGRLVNELATEAFLRADPVLQASYAHYALVLVHPFADGNGRVARALASVYLYSAVSVPLLIFVDQQDEYLASLEAADGGRYEEFVHFVAATARSTIALVTESVRTELTPSLDDNARALRQMITPRASLSETELERVGNYLADSAVGLAQARIVSLELPAGLTLEVRRLADPPLSLRLASMSGQPFRVDIQSDCRIHIRADDPERAFEVAELSNGGPSPLGFVTGSVRQPPIDFATRDVYPALTVAGELRLREFVERWLAFDLAKLREAVADGLQK
jgi:Fic family protein